MNLFEQVQIGFQLADPDEKMEFCQTLTSNWFAGNLTTERQDMNKDIQPGRPARPEIVLPRLVSKRHLSSPEGQAAMLHALAHIEWTAVHIAWDNVLQFSVLPSEFLDDWMRTAAEESRHFSSLRNQIRMLGFDYGDFPVHDQLWQMTLKTRHSLMARMGIVHRVFEARALDVVPGICRKYEQKGLPSVVRVLETIANEEISHVGAGSRWFQYESQRLGLNPVDSFFELIRTYIQTHQRGPLNCEARRQAGFTEEELSRLSSATD